MQCWGLLTGLTPDKYVVVVFVEIDVAGICYQCVEGVVVS